MYFSGKLSQKKKGKFENYKNSSLYKDDDVFSDDDIDSSVTSPFDSKKFLNNNNLQVMYECVVYCSNKITRYKHGLFKYWFLCIVCYLFPIDLF